MSYESDDFDKDLDINILSSINPNINDKPPLKSIYGRKCISKCYSKGTTYLHPTILTGIFNNNYNSCAINPVPNEYGEMIYADTCRVEDNDLFNLPNEMESILLSFYFDPRDFLSSIYDLNSFDQVITWTIENSNLPYDTIKRVHNCAWKIYGKESLSSDVFSYYYEIASNSWLKTYVKIIRNNYSFDIVSKLYSNDNLEEIYSLLLNDFFTYSFFVTSLKKYIDDYSDKWDLIYSHYDAIKRYIFHSLIEILNEKSND